MQSGRRLTSRLAVARCLLYRSLLPCARWKCYQTNRSSDDADEHERSILRERTEHGSQKNFACID